MRCCLRGFVGVSLIAAIFVAGCAVATATRTPSEAEQPAWRGRLALRVETDQPGPESASTAISAGFEIRGSPSAGELTLYTPLGSTAASLVWRSGTAVLRQNGAVRDFESLDALIKQTLGTELPVAALFAWLAGDPLMMAGWSADLSQHGSGRITARRMQPVPVAELLVILER